MIDMKNYFYEDISNNYMVRCNTPRYGLIWDIETK